MPAGLCITFQHSFTHIMEATFRTCSHWDIPERDELRTCWFLRLLPQDPGSDRAHRTSPEAAALPPSPAGEGLDSQAELQPLCPPLFVLSSFLLCLFFLSHIQATAVRSDYWSLGCWCLPLFDILSVGTRLYPALLCPKTRRRSLLQAA